MTGKDKITEEKIFEAATEEFEQRGMEGARMQDIADRAGINKALLHYYFRTKEKLFSAVFDKLAQKMFKKFAAVFEMDMPFEAKIQYFFSEHISFLEKNQSLPLFIIREVHRNPVLLKKFLDNINIENIQAEMKKNLPGAYLTEYQIAHIMISIISLSVFPVLASPILKGILDKQGIDFKAFLEERKEFSPWFVMCAINGMPQTPFNDKKK
ncbi:MAG: TetR/AcrR family transcriptional regulator [Marinilabiliaceae bacterium]|jgi:AcrR family transcriptional regulator|nr:TetR/AcrR family transcriptional regulator [Marinilabiliaceae bacterium]